MKRIPVKNQFDITGNVSLYSLPPDMSYEEFQRSDKKKLLVDNGYNLVVDMGLKQILDLMVGVDTDSFDYCGVGSGTTTPANSDEDIETTIGSRVLVTDRWRGGLSGYWSTYFGKNDNNGTWAESVIANASTGGEILCHRLFDSTFAKSTSNSAVIEWVITLSAVAD